MLTGTFAGLVNGVIISRMKIPPFIATLGMMMIARGLSLVIATMETGTVKPIYFNDTPVFRQITMGSVPRPAHPTDCIPGFRVPNAVFICLAPRWWPPSSSARRC